MIKSSRSIYPLYIFIDISIIVLIFGLFYIFRYNSFSSIVNSIHLPNPKEYLFIFSLWGIFINISFTRKGLCATDRSLTIPREISKVAMSIFSASILISAVIFFAQYKFFSRAVFFNSFSALLIFLTSWRVIKRLILRQLISKGFHNINVLIIGAGRVGRLAAEVLHKNPWWGLRVAGFLDDKVEKVAGSMAVTAVLGKLRDFPAVIKRYFIDEVIITIPSEKKTVSELIDYVKKSRVGMRIIPNNFEGPLPIVDISYLGIIPLLTYKERKHHPAEYALKRLFDFLISLFCLILLSPVLSIISVLIKLDSKGPIFYKQERVGYKGRVFNVYKFRSMVVNADVLKKDLLHRNEVKDGIIFKIKDDPRITAIGRFLRRYSIDELPQLFNVFKGNMSLVGPRPPTSDEVEKYDHNHMQRLSIRPGMTGLSQVKGRSELTFKKWVRWDLWYVNNWSFWLDFLILQWTLPTVIKGKGAY